MPKALREHEKPNESSSLYLLEVTEPQGWSGSQERTTIAGSGLCWLLTR